MINHEELNLSNHDVLEMYRLMLTARRVDERMWLLNRAGKIPFVVSCQGQEAQQVGAAFALDRNKDYSAPYYRDLGVVLTLGMTVKELMLQAYAKAEDPNSGGRQMPGHFGSKRLRMISGSSPVTTQVPHAVGVALACQMNNESALSFVTLGEGSSNQGDFHEGANFAAVHKLPVIIMIENNQYAISVPLKKQVACERLSDRAIGYGMYGETVDGNNPLAVYKVVKEAAERARNGDGPSLIEAISYRLTPHSSDDDDRTYRSQEEVDEAKEQDGLKTFRQYLFDHQILTEAVETKLEDEIKAEIDEATDYAESAPYPSPDTLFDGVYQ
ncbi:thiamine pyrophosphate-dependent dehydrogenase E1 component subunit alpha [Amphibacillus sp. MSJ-3]|uniref:thiamine pyrophosphate-dependent dehydrogenase E1 component subunit alpha n=1 Tax=Amphibacillus sp. MSJ-3 TaxID=2841505 RepID=UPI001C0EE760|nr:thiamine pyrophosphate-dependent dehydrogenase E1 component subunit alpha [Amphibacillus sp. MSJ-3]MBU5594816.1 thiamine pyrophosphate-dependent dehydrogenase E1 component subunit alpha [Amphibacillus sp. MSJ-3]